MTDLAPAALRRRFLTLVALRWLPTGLLIPVLVLLPLQRGLSLAQVGLAMSVQGLVVLCLELPTGGLADALGRRPVLLAAAALGLVATGLVLTAGTPSGFVAAYAVMGVSRALDSGPLEAWYVDGALAHDPDAALERGLAAGGTALGVAVGSGALASGALVALGPVAGLAALAVPVAVAMAVQLVDLVAVAALLRERAPGRGAGALRSSVRAVPALVSGGLAMLRRHRVLRLVVAVELFWGFGMVAFESLTPVRLAQVLADPQAAAAVFGPATSAAWWAAALGAALAGLLARRVDVALAAAALRVAQGVAVVAMGLVGGAAGVVAGYLMVYVVHGASNPLHMTLLHREVDASHRATVISLNSMVAAPAGALGLVALSALADGVSVTAAMLLGGLALALAAPLYLPARRRAAVGPGRLVGAPR